MSMSLPGSGLVGGRVSLLNEERAWEANGHPRRAGVSSFGISGTNAHVILEEPPVGTGGAALGSKDLPHADGEVLAGLPGEVGGGGGFAGFARVLVRPSWVLSGKSERGLGGQAGRLRSLRAGDVGLMRWMLGFRWVGRSVFAHRAVVIGDRDGLLNGLEALADGAPSVAVVEAQGHSDAGGVVFVFAGQGSQWPGMALGLLDSSPVFADELRICEEALASYVDWSLEDVLRGRDGAPGLDRVDVVQPVLFCVMVSLAGLWRACGVRPGVVVGHSQGEIAAAHVAGGLSLEDAARLVVVRSRALVGLMGRGGMVSVALGAQELEPWLERWEGEVSLAAVNGPSSVVVSGERSALDGLLAELVEGGVRAREIPVGYASHATMIEEIRQELLDACEGVSPVSGDVPFCSTVTGGLLDTSELDAEYWYRNLRETVRFEGVIRLLLADGYRAFVEVSPHPVLTVGVQDSVGGAVGGSGWWGAGHWVVASRRGWL